MAGRWTDKGQEARAMVFIREERPEDIPAIREVNQQAFGRPGEGQLVDALRENGAILASLVAVQEGKVVGHILYSPVTAGSGGESLVGAGLGPMAVLPGCQRQGIGGKLIEAGNQKMGEAGYPFIVVLGHTGYYPRFGFRPARSYGVRCEWEVPEEVFMILVLEPVKMEGVSGLVSYRPEFSSVT
jgi:putative acetyltransferase